MLQSNSDQLQPMFSIEVENSSVVSILMIQRVWLVDTVNMEQILLEENFLDKKKCWVKSFEKEEESTIQF